MAVCWSHAHIARPDQPSSLHHTSEVHDQAWRLSLAACGLLSRSSGCWHNVSRCHCLSRADFRKQTCTSCCGPLFGSHNTSYQFKVHSVITCVILLCHFSSVGGEGAGIPWSLLTAPCRDDSVLCYDSFTALADFIRPYMDYSSGIMPSKAADKLDIRVCFFLIFRSVSTIKASIGSWLAVKL